MKTDFVLIMILNMKYHSPLPKYEGVIFGYGDCRVGVPLSFSQKALEVSKDGRTFRLHLVQTSSLHWERNDTNTG